MYRPNISENSGDHPKMRKQKKTGKKARPKELLSPKSGTATSSPAIQTASPTIINVMLWMKKEAYKDSTIEHFPLFNFLEIQLRLFSFPIADSSLIEDGVSKSNIK